MDNKNGFSQSFEITGRDFGRAGMISTEIKDILQDVGIPASTIRRAAIASYEAEMNVVMYATRGTLKLSLTPSEIRIRLDDEGPGIPNLELAMQEGYSTATDEMREMGFGAGMGLPNMKKNSDEFEISSVPGKGTSLAIVLHLNTAKLA